MPINSFSSHRLENLAEELKCNMRNSSAMRQVIIVPGADVKEWITRNFVKQWGVAFGFKVLDLSSAVDYFSRLSDEGQRRGVPSRSLFALYLSVLLERNGKIAHVSDRLAKLFLSYGKYGGSWLESWKRGGGWQQELWKEVESDWAFPKLSKAPEITHEIHLFALPDMPSLYADYFEKLGEHWKIHLYHFSPCGEYWEDILSEKGAFRLDEIYKKEGVKEEEREVFRNIASDVPFLLANYGKLGRENFAFYQRDENSGDFSYDCRSLLESMQGDLVSMEENVWEGENRSVQMHSASSRRDEIEGVYKTLIHLAVEDPSFDPKQVKIYAPDISLYLPFIISRFGSSTSPFSFTVSGLPLSSESPFLKGFLHLLSLAKSRWTPPEVLALFHCRAFTERHDLNTSEVAQFKEWVYESRVRWGYEGEHRGTWHETLEKWVMSLAIQGEAFPLEMSDAPLIGKIFRLISSLHDDLQFFSQDRLIGDAVAFLRVVSEVYFMGDEEGSAALSQALKELSVLAVRFPEEKISFPVLYDYLSKVLSRKKGSIGGGGISFQSIQSGNFSPAQVVVVLGMDEESFPRREMPDHLSEIKKWVPSSGETDRFSLLEALFSARKTFILSHTSVDARDGKSVAASIFTRDLMETIEKKGSSVFKVVHPPLPFDQSYFSEDAYPKSYSVDDYTCAKMNYGVKKVLPRLIPDFYVKSVARSVLDETKQILTTDLTKLVRNPIQFYFNSQLGIYEREGAFFDAEGEFIPSPLDRYAVRQKALHRGWEEASKTEARMFPGGLFGDIAREKVSCEVDEYRLAMEKFEIDRDEIFSVQLSRSCRAPQKRGNVWILPAIETEKCVIHGLISDVTSRGLISYKKGRTADILARWADLVVWSQVRDCIDKEDCSLFFLGSGKKRDFSEDLGACALEQLLGYHEKAITEISPLHPLFFEGLFEPSVEAFQRYLEKSYGSLDFGFVDRYFSWLQKTQPQFEGSAIFEKWAPIAKDNFAVFHEWAMGGKR